jgi:multidrug efflux pump subunit AcrA (membrane-fusion protein)
MKRTLWISLIVAALTGCHSKEAEPAKPLVEVKVSRAEESDVSVTVRAPATVFAREQANIASRLTAPIRELTVRKGDSVSAGQILARLENRDLLAQRVEAAASLADAEASLAKVSSGTLPTEIERARGQVETTRAALNQAQRFYDRRKQLFEQGAIPGRDLLVSETDLAQAKTNHEVALKALQLLEGQSKERDLQIARSRVEQARGRLAFVEAQLTYSEVRSPFAGTVTEQFVFSGDMAKPDTSIFTVADLSVAIARAQVPEANASEVRRGEVCRLQPSDRPESVFPGTVTVVNRAVDTARRTVEVWCEIANGGQQLRAGVFGTVVIETGSLKKAVVVPITAVQFEEGTSKGYVMVVGQDKKAARRAVETTPAETGKVAILQGLRNGETVIVEGGYGLEDGTSVTWQGAGEQGAPRK